MGHACMLPMELRWRLHEQTQRSGVIIVKSCLKAVDYKTSTFTFMIIIDLCEYLPVYTCIYINAETPKEVYDALGIFGYNDFRPGQEKAIMRILCGKICKILLF